MLVLVIFMRHTPLWITLSVGKLWVSITFQPLFTFDFKRYNIQRSITQKLTIHDVFLFKYCWRLHSLFIPQIKSTMVRFLILSGGSQETFYMMHTKPFRQETRKWYSRITFGVLFVERPLDESGSSIIYNNQYIEYLPFIANQLFIINFSPLHSGVIEQFLNNLKAPQTFSIGFNIQGFQTTHHWCADSIRLLKAVKASKLFDNKTTWLEIHICS